MDKDIDEDFVVPDINFPEILPAKQVKLPNENNEYFPKEMGYTMHNGTIYFNLGD